MPGAKTLTLGLGDLARGAVTRASETPRQQVERLYRSHAQRVMHWAVRLGCSRSDAQDTVQEVFLVAQRRLALARRGEAEVNRWLFGLVRRAVHDLRKRERRHGDLAVVAYHPAIAAVGGSEVERLHQRRRLQRLCRLLDTLREAERTAFILAEFDELSGKEAADLMGIPGPSFRTLLQRGRARLLAQLRTEEEEPGSAG